MLDLVGLDEKNTYNILRLSYQVVKCAVSQLLGVLAMEPEVLVLDEPTAGFGS